MPSNKRFEEIVAWQKARLLVSKIYQVCDRTPLRRDFGLCDQIRRASVSSMTNIAEGFGRKTDGDFAHFLDVARASVLEVESLINLLRISSIFSKTNSMKSILSLKRPFH